MSLSRSLAFGFFFLFFTLVADAAGPVPHIRYLGQTFDDFEVCFYPYDVDDPYSGFEGAEYRCAEIRMRLTSPFAPSAFFYRRGELISAHHSLFMPHQYARFENPFVPNMGWSVAAGGTLDLSRLELEPGEHFSLIIASAPRVRLSVVPIEHEEGELVPSRTPLLVARVRDGRPVAVSESFEVRPYDVHALSALDGTGVFVRFQLEGGMANRDYIRRVVARLPVPIVSLRDARGVEHMPEWIPYYPASVNGMLYYFADVPPGEAKLVARGSGWKTATRSIAVGTGVTVVEETVVLRVAE